MRSPGLDQIHGVGLLLVRGWTPDMASEPNNALKPTRNYIKWTLMDCFYGRTLPQSCQDCQEIRGSPGDFDEIPRLPTVVLSDRRAAAMMLLITGPR
jgi:hypothetical protein